MKKIWKMAIIIVLLLPAITQARASSPEVTGLKLITGDELTAVVDNEEIDPSFELVDLNIEEIVVYPHNIVLIRMDGTVVSGNKFYADLLGNAFPGCLRIMVDGSNVKDISIKTNYRYNIITPTVENTFTVTKMLMDNIGKEIELLTKDGFYKGDIVGVFNGLIFLREVTFTRVLGDTLQQRNVSFICLKLNDVENIVMMEEPDLPDINESEEEVKEVDTKPKTRVMWEDTGSGSREVTLLYIISGVSWNSEYYLDMFTPFEDGEDSDEDARLEHWAVIKNNLGFDLEDINVRLVAGDIKLENSGYSNYKAFEMSYAHALINDYEDVGRGSGSTTSIFSLQEFVVFTLPYKITLKEGVTKKIQLQNCDVEIEEEFVYDASHFQPSRNSLRTWEGEAAGKVHKILKVKNNGKTWPAGMVHVYQDYMLIGQDGIEWTPKGRSAKVTIGISSDIDVKKKATVKKINPEDRYNDDYHYKIVIEIKNYKEDEVTIKVFDYFNSRALDLKADPDFEEKPGNTMTWEITLEPGEEKKIEYTYEIRD